MPVDPDWIVSRYCEEFNCGVVAALHDLEAAPNGMVERIFELRAIARAKQVIDRAKSMDDIPTGEVYAEVQELEALAVRQRMAEQRDELAERRRRKAQGA